MEPKIRTRNYTILAYLKMPIVTDYIKLHEVRLQHANETPQQ